MSKNIVHVNQRFPSESNIFLVMELRMPVYLIEYILKFLLHDLDKVWAVPFRSARQQVVSRSVLLR